MSLDAEGRVEWRGAGGSFSATAATHRTCWVTLMTHMASLICLAYFIGVEKKDFSRSWERLESPLTDRVVPVCLHLFLKDSHVPSPCSALGEQWTHGLGSWMVHNTSQHLLSCYYVSGTLPILSNFIFTRALWGQLLPSIFYRQENWGTKRFSNMPKVPYNLASTITLRLSWSGLGTPV